MPPSFCRHFAAFQQEFPSGTPFNLDRVSDCTLVPRHKTPIHAGKISWGINVCANTCGACIRTRANTEKYFRGIIFRILAKFLRELISGRIHVAPVFAPARIQEKHPGELFMYWFHARGYHAKFKGVIFSILIAEVRLIVPLQPHPTPNPSPPKRMFPSPPTLPFLPPHPAR